LGVGAFVHYDVRMGDHAVLDADSFLMKGEVVEPYTVWRGNPARMHRGNAVRQQATVSGAANNMAPCQKLPEVHIPREAAE